MITEYLKWNTPLAYWRKKRMREFHRQFIKPGNLVFDIGANMGNYTAIFRELGAWVLAIEPQPECAKSMRKRFAGYNEVGIVQNAIGQSVGWGELMVSQNSNLATLNQDWVNAVTCSRRFGKRTWKRDSRMVYTTTIDRCIEALGIPSFIKIDVEGYELKVIQGMSQPVKLLSFEFVPEYLSQTFEAMKLLDLLGMQEFNISLEDTMKFEFPEWVDRITAMDTLETYAGSLMWGDVYARRKI